MARTVQVTIDAADPERLGLFWAEALGYVVEPPPGGEPGRGAEQTIADWADFLDRAGVPREQQDAAFAVSDPDGAGPRIFLQRVPEPKTAKNRVHLDVRAAPDLQGDDRMAALEAEADRLVALGATRLARHEPSPPMSAGFIVLADPEGNELCLD